LVSPSDLQGVFVELIMTKIIAVPAQNDREAYIQLSSWTRPEGGPWAPIKDKTSGAIYGWRHYYPHPEACQERTGITPPPAPSVSLDGGTTWTPFKGVREPDWVTSLKADSQVKWHIRREAGKLLARKAKS
jgi:hypothetical protein